MSIRIGHGYDLHRLAPEPGGGVALGGVTIACDYRVIAHSDGDVVIHALCDALLGAIAAGDIGSHFPDSDPRWRGVASSHFLRSVRAMLDARGLRVINADCTVLAQVPRVAPHVAAMRAVLAECLAVDVDAIGVKATTTEGVGAIGEKAAIAAHAVALVGSVDG